MTTITTAEAERLAEYHTEEARHIDLAIAAADHDTHRHAMISQKTAAALRSLSAERDALLSDWRETAAIVTTDEPEVGKLWEVVGEAVGAGNANREYFRREIVAHNATKAERDALREERDALREACRMFVAWLDAEDTSPDYGSLTRDTHPEGERIWREWWERNLRLCKAAQEHGRAALGARAS